MVRHILEMLEPEPAQLRQHAPFIGNPCRQNPVERTDPIGAHQEQRVAQIVNVTHLAASHGQVGKRSLCDGRRHSGFQSKWFPRRSSTNGRAKNFAPSASIPPRTGGPLRLLKLEVTSRIKGSSKYHRGADGTGCPIVKFLPVLPPSVPRSAPPWA